MPPAVKALLALVLFAASAHAAVYEVSWGFFASSASLTIRVGDSVTWKWNQSSIEHTLISGVFPGDTNVFGVRYALVQGD